MDRPVLIMSALAGELGLLSAAMAGDDETLAGGHTFRTGTIGEREVVVTSAGVGKVNAAMVATLAIDHFAPREVVFTGVAGGVDPMLRIGDVVVADHVLQHDAGVLRADGFEVYQAGHVPFFNPSDDLGYRPSPGLLDRARSAVADVQMSPVLGRVPAVVFGTVTTGDQFIESENERRRLHETLGALVVEMEGAAVAQVACHFGVDHLVIRAVSDRVGVDSAVDFARFLDEVAVNSSRVVLAMVSGL
jgi:adenosylhomocysteine nucleosidase